MKFLALALSLFALFSCNRDPNVAKRRYLENGNKYFERGKYKEASIMYRNALQKDQRFGPAHYHLALAELKVGRLPSAVGSFHRAIDTLTPNQPEYWDARIKLAEVYLAASGQAQTDKRYLDEVETTANDLLKRDPNSYDGHRLTADLNFLMAQKSNRAGDKESSKKLLQVAIQEYRKADSLKPGDPPLMMAMARSMVADQQFPEGERIYRSIIQKDKTFVSAYTDLYQLLLIQKRAGEAETILKEGVANNPKRYSFLTLLAAHYYGTKRRDEMVKVLNQFKSHADEFKQVYAVTGDFYLRLGEPDEAIKQYREGMEKDATRKALYQKRVVEVLMRQGKRRDASVVNEQILKDNPKDTDARGLKASLMIDQGEIQKALVELQSVVTTAPDNFVARYNLGRAHFARGEYEQARQQFEEAIKLRPDYLPPRIAMGQLQIARRQYDLAVKSVEGILKIDPRNGAGHLIESAALMGMKKFNESRQVLQTMSTTFPNSPDVYFQLGMVNLAERKFKEAEAGFRKTHELNPANSRGLMGIVETYLVQQKGEDAIKLLQAESEKNPKRLDYRMALGNTAVRTGKYDMAISQYQGILGAVDANSRQAAEIYLRLGETYRRKGDLNNGLAMLQKARAITPENSGLVLTLALTLDGAGKKLEAKHAYEQVVKLDPANPYALNNLAYLMAESGDDLDQALTFAQRAKQILPTLNEVSDTLGWIYLKKNLSDSAIGIFQDLVKKEPRHSTYRYHLGMAFAQKGDKPRAQKELMEAIKSNPAKEEEAKIKELLGKLG